jgi:translation initiation factor IF-1
MARIRMVKPEFFDDPSIAELTPLARLFFIGLWTQADREGRLVDDMRRLKVRIFPYDNVDVEALAVELHGKDMIRRYACEDGHRYIWIRSFIKHQRPHPKEPASVIPPCIDRAVKGHGEPCKETANPSESGFLSLDSGVLIPHAQPVHAAASPLNGFDAFWEVYPKKRAKGQAVKAWKALKPAAELQARILEAVQVQARFPEWRKEGGQFVPYPASWLRARRWEDEDGPQGNAPADVDWFEECQRLHAGACGGRVAHDTRMYLDTERLKRAEQVSA